MISAQGPEICLAGNTKSYQCAYYATIQNAVTGNYIVWTTGTDINLDPCRSSSINEAIQKSNNFLDSFSKGSVITKCCIII